MVDGQTGQHRVHVIIVDLGQIVWEPLIKPDHVLVLLLVVMEQTVLEMQLKQLHVPVILVSELLLLTSLLFLTIIACYDYNEFKNI